MDENEIHDIEESLTPEPRPSRRGDDESKIPWGGVLLLFWAAVLIVFAVQNAEEATVSFLTWEWMMPVALLVLVTALTTLLLASIAWSVYRRRRRRRRVAAERADDR